MAGNKPSTLVIYHQRTLRLKKNEHRRTAQYSEAHVTKPLRHDRLTSVSDNPSERIAETSLILQPSTYSAVKTR